jgi:F-type H+-transporting ATPase subunit gamma
LIGDSRRLRQEEITAEIVELSSGELASGAATRKRPGRRERF